MRPASTAQTAFSLSLIRSLACARLPVVLGVLGCHAAARRGAPCTRTAPHMHTLTGTGMRVSLSTTDPFSTDVAGFLLPFFRQFWDGFLVGQLHGCTDFQFAAACYARRHRRWLHCFRRERSSYIGACMPGCVAVPTEKPRAHLFSADHSPRLLDIVRWARRRVSLLSTPVSPSPSLSHPHPHRNQPSAAPARFGFAAKRTRRMCLVYIYFFHIYIYVFVSVRLYVCLSEALSSPLPSPSPSFSRRMMASRVNRQLCRV